MAAEHDGFGFSPRVAERIDPVCGGWRVAGRCVFPKIECLVGEGAGHGDFVDGVFGEGDAQRVAKPVDEQGADADGALDSAIFAVARLGHSEVKWVGTMGGVHALDEQAIGLDDDLRVARFHREHDVVVTVAFANADELQRALDHAQRRVSVAVHDALGERAVVGADAQGSAQLFATADQRRNGFVQALELPCVLGIRVLMCARVFLVGVVARIDADFLNVFDRLHRGLRHEMNVGDERDVGKTGGGELGADLSQSLGGGDVGGGYADDFATDLGEGDGLADRRRDIQRVAGGHRLHPDRVGAADADGANFYLNRGSTDGL